MRNLADYHQSLVVLAPLWREDIIGFDGAQAIVRCPWITNQDSGVDLADKFDRDLDAMRARR